jgi:pyrroloquinoline quinone biosynthesis protein D
MTSPSPHPPALAAGVRLRFDTSRDTWVLLGPERIVVADPIAADVLQRIDGKTPTADIVTYLCTQYDGSPAQIAQHVDTLLQRLVTEGLVRQ